MSDKNNERDERSLQASEDHALDRKLDAALARYTAVEPRAGLEARVLANLSAERGRTSERTWWRLGIAATVAAVIVVSIVLTLRSDKSSPQQVVQHPSSTPQRPTQSSSQIVANDEHGNAGSVIRPARREAHHAQAAPVAMAASSPKLEVFPSPQPLSEQEKLLLSYARRDPDRAALLAEARMDSLRQDAEERRQLATQDQDSRE